MFIDQKHGPLSWNKRIGLSIVIMIAYFCLGNIGILFTVHTPGSSPFWPPSGFALAMILAFGIPEALPGIALGVTLLGIQSHAPNATILGLIAANLLECVMASMLLNASGKGAFRFKNPKDIFSFLVIAVFLSPFVSSTLAITSFYMGGLILLGNIPTIWTNFFIGNALGILIFTPLILSFYSKDSRKISLMEATLLYIALALSCYWSLEGHSLRKFLVVPIMTWAALRFSFRGVGIGSLVVGLLSVWTSTHIRGVFDKKDPEADLLLIQTMMAGLAIVGYFLATVVEAQETAQEKELELSINMQHKKIAEDALAILDQSIHKSPIGFALIDKDYKYLRINESLAKINGLPPEVHIGKTLWEVIPSIADNIKSKVDLVFQSGQSMLNMPLRDKQVMHADKVTAGLVSYYPVRHPSTNEIFAVAFSFQDISEQLTIQGLLQENQDRLQFAQEAGKIGAFEWDISSNCIFWTNELESIYGLEIGEFGGFFSSWTKWIHPEDLDITVKEFTKALNCEGELNHQFRIFTKDRDLRWVLARGKVVRDAQGERKKLIGINIDLTEQKTTEHKLRLTEANLLHALSVRDEFMAIASHELKTPLTSLKLQIQIFQRGIMRNDPLIYTPEKIDGLLDKNSRQIDRLTRLVDDMLDISRIRTGKFSLKKERCELTAMLRDILGRNREQFEASGSGQPIVEHIENAYGEWDPLRIEQVLTNIITNAIRYGQGNPITISVKNYQECVRLTVKDQGLGIPRFDQEKIFQRYERGLLSREVSGLGLGLFITKQIVDAHGGKIWVESEINHGATFFVDLPRSTIHITEVESLSAESQTILT